MTPAPTVVRSTIRARYGIRSVALAGVLAATMTLTSVGGASAATANLIGSNWKVYTIKASNNTWANLSKAQKVPGDGVRFDFQQFSSTTTGLYSVYLMAGINKIDLTNTTISATVSEAVTAGSLFYTRSTACANTGTDAYVRLNFQTTTSGPYTANDYWWSTQSINLSALAAQPSATLAVSTGDPSQWTNINGQSGLDQPDGFARALKSSKQIGLAFGSSCRYASGVAIANGSGSFRLSAFGLS